MSFCSSGPRDIVIFVEKASLRLSPSMQHYKSNYSTWVAWELFIPEFFINQVISSLDLCFIRRWFTFYSLFTALPTRNRNYASCNEYNSISGSGNPFRKMHAVLNAFETLRLWTVGTLCSNFQQFSENVNATANC